MTGGLGMAGVLLGDNATRLVRRTPEDEDRAGVAGGAQARHHDALRELCHDLLQPAATIGAVVAAAQVESDLSAATQARLDQVTAEAKRIAELCRDVLEGGGAPAAVVLNQLAVEVATAASLTSPGTITVYAHPTVVHGDATALRRALSNLVDNAVRAAGPDGEVNVTVRVVGGYACLTVADSGGGFGIGEGGVAGLGLRIAGRVAEEHGGGLSIGRSVELGGAEVTLSMPFILGHAKPAQGALG